VTAVAARSPRAAREGVAVEVRVGLLDGFAVTKAERPLSLPMGAQRLVAFLTLHRRPALRAFVAGTLWPETSEERALANLRSTLWRIHRCEVDLVASRGQQLALAPGVRVDLFEAEAFARQALDDSASAALELAPSRLSADLLPDWYDDWALIEREQYRQLRLRALDSLSSRLIVAGRYADALEAGLAAVAGEPLRESAHRAVVQVHLAEGNIGEAIRQYRLCCRLLQERLGLEPSELMEHLFDHVTERRWSGDRSRT
jgi:DNA-binding SARP family transcriptional activator